MSINEIDLLAAGAANCVLDCARVKKGESLFIVSERGAVDDAVVDAIVECGKGAGADVRVVWDDPIPKERADDVPPKVLEAYREADVLISHFPTLKREALVRHFEAETRVRVPNRARTVDMLASDWARFPYGLQRAIADRLDAIMAPGKSWRITAPAGTDVSGVFGDAGGLVGAAFFVDTGDEGRARRNFPGGVHSPRNCSSLDGVIVCEYLDNVGMDKADSALVAELAGSAVTGMKGGTDATCAVIEASDGFIDSWHAGVHPRTITPMTRSQNARAWFSYSHCSPDILHFHLGRTVDTVNIGVFGQTLSVDGQLLYENGRLAVENDAEMAAAVANADIPAEMMQSREMARW